MLDKMWKDKKSFDFSKDVKEWKNVHNLHFIEEVNEKETSQEMKRRPKMDNQRRTKLMFYALREEGALEDEKKYNEIMVTEIPKGLHKSPEVEANFSVVILLDDQK